jgi:hypothetical protein
MAGLTGSQLKWIAIITMFIDHGAKSIIYYGILMPNRPIRPGTPLSSLSTFYQVLRGIGRTAFPIFCFFLVQGFIYTHSRAKYAIRLFIFGIISEIPFNLAIHNSLWYRLHQNVYFTLFLGLMMLCIWEKIGDMLKDPRIAIWFQLASAAALMQLAYVLKTDYRHRGLIIILAFYLLRFYHPLACAAGAVAAYFEWPAVLPSFGLLLLYNGKRGKQRQYFFYWFYPGPCSHSKFGLEKINGEAKGIPFKVSDLKKYSDMAAEVLNVPIYGGDCVVLPNGDVKIIDFNDWPSFARCRNEAGVKIAECIYNQALKKLKNE